MIKDTSASGIEFHFQSHLSIFSPHISDAFSISTGSDGNCELRTQMQLDRETIEHYLLNISVANDDRHDYALVGITVLDDNDNTPQFVFDNELSLPLYFAAIASNAPAFTHIITVKVFINSVKYF